MNEEVDKILDLIFSFQDELCALLDQKKYWDDKAQRNRIFIQIDTAGEILFRIEKALNIKKIKETGYD